MSKNALLLRGRWWRHPLPRTACDLSGRVLGEGPPGRRISGLASRKAFPPCSTPPGNAWPGPASAQDALQRITACLALAGASEPVDLAAARQYPHPFHRVVLTTDAHAACIGAHRGADGGVIVVGTGSVGWGVIGARQLPGRRLGFSGLRRGQRRLARLRGRCAGPFGRMTA